MKDVFKKIVDDIKRKLEMLAKKDLVVKAAMEADIQDVKEAYSIFDSVLRYVQQHGEETENKKAAEEAGKLSRILGSEEYKKPITRNDLQELRSLFPTRKSINDFSEEELKETEKWAYKYYQQMGTKSPFFRAWFCDWRLHDIPPRRRY